MSEPAQDMVTGSGGRVGFKDGWQWFGSGFKRYRRNPVLMMFWVMSYWTLLGLLGMLPVLGDLLVAAMAPVLLVGVMAGCRELDRDLMPPFTVLFSGFSQRMQTLMGLGVVHFVLTLAVLAITALSDGGVLLQYLARGTLGVQDLPMPDAAEISLVSLSLAVMAYIPVLLAFAYAPLLVAWRNFGLIKSLFFSLVAAWRAWRGLAGFLAAIILYGILLPSVAMMLLVSVGLDDALVTSLVVIPIVIVLAPTVVSAMYTSYRAVLPSPSGSDA